MCIPGFNPLNERGCALTSVFIVYFTLCAAASLPNEIHQPGGNWRESLPGRHRSGLRAVQRLLILILVAMSLCSCKKTASKAEFDPKAFDSAIPAVKQEWDEAMMASNRNDPGSAISILRVLSREKISPEQQKTVYEAIIDNELKLKENAKRGDPVARKAMEKLGYGSVITNP